MEIEIRKVKNGFMVMTEGYSRGTAILNESICVFESFDNLVKYLDEKLNIKG